ncbi:MAG: Hsp70 family protein [Myxococcales bacterium]|nr:Hsp70 family protein [Myxococcales bacterium]
MKEEVAIGIDLGTSNSCVAAVIGGQPRVLPNAHGERTTASVIAFAEDGSVSVGNEARAQVILDPTHTVSSAKRLIGRFMFSEEARKASAIARYRIVEGEGHSIQIQVREQSLSVPEVSALVLKQMRSVAEQELGRSLESAVITVPALFNDNQRQATKDAGRIAGLNVLRILNEPTAAALAYGYGQDLRAKVAVYDLGGGTFDISILELGGDVFEVLATCGDTFLGGDDFDDRLIDLLAEEFQERHDKNVRSDPFSYEKLKQAAEKAKLELSEKESVTVEVPALCSVDGEALGIQREIRRGEFDQLVQDLCQRTFKVCDEALQQAGLTVQDLDGVILVGGSTRMPVVREAAKEYFRREPDGSINPEEVVAVGAAIHAASLMGSETDTFLLDVTPLSLRVGIAGGLTKVVIERNSPVPIERTGVFTTARDFQESVSIRIYQGEARTARENTLLGEVEFSGFQPGPRGEVKIEVSFAITTEGILKVSASDPVTGAERFTSVTLSGGLSEAEIERIIRAGSGGESAGSVPTGRDEQQGAPTGPELTALQPEDPRAIPLDPDESVDAELVQK